MRTDTCSECLSPGGVQFNCLRYVVFRARKKTEWDVTNADPDYHYKAIVDALKLAKERTYPGSLVITKP